MFAGEVGVTTGTPPLQAHSLKLGVTGHPRSSPVQVPAYLHKVTRAGSTPNTKVGYVCFVLVESAAQFQLRSSEFLLTKI